MLRVLILAVTTLPAFCASLLPEQFAGYKAAGVSSASSEDRALLDEFGLTASERADYGAFQTIAWRFQDSTGAFAAFQALRPPDAVSAVTSASLPEGSLVQHGNYLLRFEAGKPHPSELEQLYAKLPGVVRSSLPPLLGYLPAKDRIANSERYLLGPLALSRFEPRIPAALAGFELGCEAQSARYRVSGNEVQLTIFSYPTPQMAIVKFREFEKLADAVVKRSGPMIAVAIPKTRGAETLLTDVSYNPKLTWNEYVSKDTPQDAARMILAIFALAFILILASVAMGLVFGGFRVVRERLGMKPAADELTSLHLQ